jgi:hypothetical protein
MQIGGSTGGALGRANPARMRYSTRGGSTGRSVQLKVEELP